MAAAASLRRMLFPTISRHNFPPRQRQALHSSTGAGATKSSQVADRCMIRSYCTKDDAARREGEKQLILKQTRSELVAYLTLCSIYGACLAVKYYWPFDQHEHDFPEDDDN